MGNKKFFRYFALFSFPNKNKHSSDDTGNIISSYSSHGKSLPQTYIGLSDVIILLLLSMPTQMTYSSSVRTAH